MSKPKDLSNLIQLTKTTQALLTHYASSLAAPSSNKANKDVTPSSLSQSEISDPLSLLKSSTTLLKSHTTTLSLLIINPPFTSSAIASKIGDVSSGPLSGMVVAASYVPTTEQSKTEGAGGDVGAIMRSEMRAQVKSILGCWSEVLNLVCRIAEEKQTQLAATAGAKGGKVTVTEAEKQQVLSTTGVVWDACDALVKLCDEGVVGLVVKKAEEYRAVLLDAIEELKEWGEDVDDDDDDDDAAEGSDEEEDEDDLFGKEKKIKKDDKEMKALLDLSVKKLKMVGMLYQALIKRRLKTYPSTTLTPPSSSSTTTPSTTTEGDDKKEVQKIPSETLNALMHTLKSIPETVDDIAAAFYDLDRDEAKQTLTKCCDEAKKAIELVRWNWETGKEDEFSVWGAKWIAALDAIST